MDIVTNVVTWVHSQPSLYLAKAPTFYGGWERWAQLDMALAWAVVNHNLEVYTEDPVFEDKERADLVVAATDVGGNHYCDIVELKAWAYGAEKLSNFYEKKVGADIVKVRKALKSDIPYVNGSTRRWAIGLVSVAGVKQKCDPKATLTVPSTWTDADALDYVEKEHKETKAGDDGTVKLAHTLAANGDGSMIVTLWGSSILPAPQ